MTFLLLRSSKHGKNFVKCDIMDVVKFRLIYICQLTTRELVISGLDFSEIIDLYFKKPISKDILSG